VLITQEIPFITAELDQAMGIHLQENIAGLLFAEDHTYIFPPLLF
jgi:hypothetical protein